MARGIKKEISGNTAGVKKSMLIALSALFEIKSSGYADEKILRTAAEVTLRTGREIGIIINRKGFIADISIGTEDRSAVSELSFNPRDPMRALHTHPGGNPALSDLDRTAFTQSALDAMASAGVDDEGNIIGAEVVFRDGGHERVIFCADLSGTDIMGEIYNAKRAKKETSFKVKKDVEYALAVGVDMKKDPDVSELSELIRTAGAIVKAVVTQTRQSPDKATFAGKGKLEEIREICQLEDIDVVVFDNELSGIQLRNIEAALGVKVIDRSMLILDIFAGRAKSLEGKLQVELAQLKYNQSRLIGIGGKMDKLRSGIGMRGPGEKKLELDRRRINEKIHELEQKIAKLKNERNLRRVRRGDSGAKTVALVGYTNAGKSTIMNVLARSDLFAEDMLFATLDPVTRKVFSESGTYLLTDTVGFIDKLPHEFIEAFHSTLEEARQADVLLHVADCSNPAYTAQMKVVEEVLKKLEIVEKDVITVYNKADKLSDTAEFDGLTGSSGVLISAKTGFGVDKLKNMIKYRLFSEKAIDKNS